MSTLISASASAIAQVIEAGARAATHSGKKSVFEIQCGQIRTPTQNFATVVLFGRNSALSLSSDIGYGWSWGASGDDIVVGRRSRNSRSSKESSENSEGAHDD
jgi:hypothetical protein